MMFVPAVLLAVGLMQGSSNAPTYDAAFVLEQGTYTGTTTFSVDAKGVVTGTMRLTSPIGVDGTLGGTVKDGVWAVEFPYTIPEQGCGGMVQGTGKVAEDGARVSGDVTISGSCTEVPLPASFTFVRQAK